MGIGSKKNQKQQKKVVNESENNNNSSGRTDDRKYIRSFDSIRGFVILIAVTIGHYWQFTPASYYADGTSMFWTEFTNKITQFSFSKSYTFMELLLMISGFQMYSYYKKIENGEVNFATYFKKRVARLFPLTIITTLFMFIFGQFYLYVKGESWFAMNMSFKDLWFNLLNIQAWFSSDHSLNGPLWYVSVYFLCLILYYPLIRIGKKLNIGIFAMSFPIFLSVLIVVNEGDKFLYNPDVARGYYGFFLGVITAYIGSKMSKKQIYIYSGISIAVFAFFYFALNDRIYSGNIMDRVSSITIMCYMPLLILLATSERLDRIIGNKVLSKLGEISYSLYVLNFPFFITLACLEIMGSFAIPYGRTIYYWIMPVIQIVVAALFYKKVEVPLNRKVKAITKT